MMTVLAVLVTGYFTHETASGGLTKFCHYETERGAYVLTIDAASVCPVTVKADL